LSTRTTVWEYNREVLPAYTEHGNHFSKPIFECGSIGLSGHPHGSTFEGLMLLCGGYLESTDESRLKTLLNVFKFNHLFVMSPSMYCHMDNVEAQNWCEVHPYRELVGCMLRGTVLDQTLEEFYG
jgi:hypothetical protein